MSAVVAAGQTAAVAGVAVEGAAAVGALVAQKSNTPASQTACFAVAAPAKQAVTHGQAVCTGFARCRPVSHCSCCYGKNNSAILVLL